MEQAFANLQKDGKNDVDNLIKWMKDSKVIKKTEEQEEKVRSYFNDVVDKKNVTLDNFEEVINKVVEESKKSLEAVTKQLAEHGPKLLQSAVDGATTLKGAVKDRVPKM